MDCSTFIRLWRNWIRLATFLLYAVAICIALPLCIWQLNEKGAPRHVQAWFVGGIFVMMALPISIWGIVQHVINYTTPHLQKFIIRILWMVPIYALNAWFALRFPAAAIYLDTLRECYEAYVIYNFMAYLLSFLNHEYPHLDVQVQNKPPVHFMFPLCFLPPVENSEKFITRCKHGVLQYTVVRPAMTILALICEMFDKYNEGDFDFKSAWSYIVVINNLSQVLAMYCLVLFYKAFKEELHFLNPVPKFLCVKAVVFLSFWQSLVIAALAKLGVIPQDGPWIYYDNVKEVSTGIQDFCICVEMFFAALAHYYSFSHKPFINLAAEQQNCCTSFLLMWDIRDVSEDVVEHARYIGRGMHKTISRGARLANSLGGRGDERTPLLSGGQPETQAAERFDQNSVEHMQTQRTPSPAELINVTDGNESHSAGGDSTSIASSRNRYGSFTTKSTTSSMYNYADFTASTDEEELRKARGNRRQSGFGKSIEGVIIGPEDEAEGSDLIQSTSSKESHHVQSSKHVGMAAASRSARPGDDVFEHLDSEQTASSGDPEGTGESNAEKQLIPGDINSAAVESTGETCDQTVVKFNTDNSDENSGVSPEEV